MKDDCVFCKIIAGEIPSYKIYEDDFCMAFLDISNDLYGHTLVVSKKHYENLMECDSHTLTKILETCKLVGKHYVENCGFDGFNILNNCGEAAEQSVMHIHFHILPRKKKDGFKVFPNLGESKIKIDKACKKLKIEEPKATKDVYTKGDCVVAYTDGACSGNPGAGGWAAILTYKGKEKIITGGEKDTTNNRMELMGAIGALESVNGKVKKVKLVSDSAYVVNCFNQGWMDKWLKNNWKNSSGDPVLNQDLWQRLLKAKEKFDVEFIKVKGHADNENNNRCDALARNEIAKLED